MAVIRGTKYSNYINGYSSNDIIDGQGGNDIILGNKGNDVLYGGSGNDRFFTADNLSFVEHFWGTEGSDTMYGGTGNDMYLVDNAGDKVIEYANQGIDTVYSYISYTLPANVENGYLIIAGLKDLYGNGLNNKLNGNCYANHIKGYDGNDIIFGGGYGKDTLEGGNGNDWIQASVSNCQLYGNAGNDTLIGSNGNDTLCGGSGWDIYRGFVIGKITDTISDPYGYFYKFGHDVIRDFTNNGSTISNNSATEHNMLDLSTFSLNSLYFKAIDTDYDKNVDALYISAGKYGSVQIDKYFSDTSRYISHSSQGIGTIYDIQVGTQHLHFNDIVNILT